MEGVIVWCVIVVYFLGKAYKERLKTKKIAAIKEQERLAEYNREREYKQLLEKYLELVKPHLPVLHRKYKQLVIQDDYGNYQMDRYKNEIIYFIEATFNIKNVEMIFDLQPKILKLVSEYKGEEINNFDDKLYFNKYMSPVEYEHFCSNLLMKNNWKSNVTQQTGDQGVDIIAELNHTKIAIQCKLYSSPVGNKAVQEVFAAQKHIGAQYAVVITNNTYTRAAKELANTTSVLLLHHDDLNNLEKIIFN